MLMANMSFLGLGLIAIVMGLLEAEVLTKHIRPNADISGSDDHVSN